MAEPREARPAFLVIESQFNPDRKSQRKQPMKKAKKRQVATPVERRSFKLKRAEYFWLQELAQDTQSLYRGKATWRRLIARIAGGELVVSVAKPKAAPALAWGLSEPPMASSVFVPLTRVEQITRDTFFNDAFKKFAV